MPPDKARQRTEASRREEIEKLLLASRNLTLAYILALVAALPLGVFALAAVSRLFNPERQHHLRPVPLAAPQAVSSRLVSGQRGVQTNLQMGTSNSLKPMLLRWTQVRGKSTNQSPPTKAPCQRLQFQPPADPFKALDFPFQTVSGQGFGRGENMTFSWATL